MESSLTSFLDQLINVLNVEHIDHVGKMSVSGYIDRRFKPRMHQNVVSLSKILNSHCLSRFICVMSTRLEHQGEGCFSVL